MAGSFMFRMTMLSYTMLGNVRRNREKRSNLNPNSKMYRPPIDRDIF